VTDVSRSFTLLASICALGCATGHAIHRPPTPAEIGEINGERRIQVVPLPNAGWPRRAVRIDHIVSANAERLVVLAAGTPVAIPLDEVDRFRSRRRGPGAAVGAAAGAGAGALVGMALSLLASSWGSRDAEYGDRDFPWGAALGVAAVTAAVGSAGGAVVGAVVGAPQDFSLPVGPARPAAYDPTTRSPDLAPPRAATVVAPTAEVRSAPFEVAPVIVRFTRGERLFVDPTPNAGWWVLSLVDGRVGYVRDTQVQVASP
jgi:hypothetical protein